MATAIRDARPATLLLAAAVAASAALLLGLGAHLTFLLDDWEVLVYRRGFGADAILTPHGENIAIGPVLVYKALLEIFGMGSALPFRVVSVGTFLVSACLLFVWLRRRVGEWLALAGALIVLFLGSAWEDLLWAFQVGYFGSMAAGLGALLALERGDRRGDVIACALLTISVLFSSLGLPFLLATAVVIGFSSKGERVSRLFALVIPAGVFALWWLGWGRDADTAISYENVVTAPLFLLDGVSAALSSLLGLATPRDESTVSALDWGRPLLVLVVGLIGWRLWKLRRIDPALLVVVSLPLAFWLLAGFNEKPGREPLASRYVYIGVIFVLLIAGQLLDGVRLRRPALVAAFAVVALAVLSNISYLHQAYKSYLGTSQIELADLGALEIARDTVEPGFRLDENIAHTAYVGIAAEPYFSAVDAFGSPAYDDAEIADAPAEARAAADSVLTAALRMTSDPGAAPGAGPCQAVALAAGRPQAVDLAPGGASVNNRGDGPVTLTLRRFGDEFATDAGTVAPGEGQTITIPPDRSAHPWQLQLRGRGDVDVCAIGGTG